MPQKVAACSRGFAIFLALTLITCSSAFMSSPTALSVRPSSSVSSARNHVRSAFPSLLRPTISLQRQSSASKRAICFNLKQSNSEELLYWICGACKIREGTVRPEMPSRCYGLLTDPSGLDFCCNCQLKMDGNQEAYDKYACPQCKLGRTQQKMSGERTGGASVSPTGLNGLLAELNGPDINDPSKAMESLKTAVDTKHDL